jgi:hypothetical protein
MWGRPAREFGQSATPWTPGQWLLHTASHVMCFPVVTFILVEFQFSL